MPHVMYGGRDGQRIDLENSNDYLVVRTRSGRSLVGGVVPRPEQEALGGFAFRFRFAEAGVEVFERTSRARGVTVARAKKALRNFDDTRFAGRVLVDVRASQPVIYTENLFVKFADELTAAICLSIIDRTGLHVKRAVDYVRNGFFIGATEGCGQDIFAKAAALLEDDHVDLCHPELVRQRSDRQVFPEQWHLRTTTVNGIQVNASASVAAAHATSTGAGTVIAIIDDGVDIAHPEFAGAGKVVAPLDVAANSDDPFPKTIHDNHGTACAGVACAAGVLGASGVAPDALLMPIRMAPGLGAQGEADAIAWAANHGADVISCSWGPQDGHWWDSGDPLHNLFAPLPDATRLAIDHAVNNGRNGRGCVIMWAAGNGNESVQNDGYASYPNVFAVAACNDRGVRSVYSDKGESLFCSFPSNDFEFPEEGRQRPLTNGIWTTDRRHGAGYNIGQTSHGDIQGLFTNGFGGTSSACPGAAGVAALVIATSPDLHWQQVGDVLRQSCDQIDGANGDYVDGHSPWYGYGRLNAETAVRLAQPEEPADSIAVHGNFLEPVRDFRESSVTLQINDPRPVRDVQIDVDIRHSYIGDLTVTLRPPTGRGIVLHRRTGRGTNNIHRTYDAGTVDGLANLVGKHPTGTWELAVQDDAFRDQGMIRSFGVRLTFGGASRNAKDALPSSGDSVANQSTERTARKQAPATARRKAVRKKKAAPRRKRQT